ncbi:FHA domain-containing protein [Priestia megaterium]|nr:FHA domain-containing protein [Priestia megaterium]
MNSTFIIQQGAPFHSGTSIPLPQTSPFIIGRKGEGWLPDLAFQSAYISRKHFKLVYEQDAYCIIDLNSKHGTKINGERLLPNKPYALKNNDCISIANETAVLTFMTEDMDATLELGPLVKQLDSQNYFTLDPILQKVKVEDEVYVLSDKEYACLSYLLQTHDTFVSKETLKKHIWPERVTSDDELFVSAEELNSLMYRVRKKVGNKITIEVIRGKGYILRFNKAGVFK